MQVHRNGTIRDPPPLIPAPAGDPWKKPHLTSPVPRGTGLAGNRADSVLPRYQAIEHVQRPFIINRAR
ncbi:hypothetical protein [Methanoregula sp.]|uniref:hypothetical protein n=1 Tax=Methanoregula sp. TaxID=2052170 RepID=UPI003C76B4CE